MSEIDRNNNNNFSRVKGFERMHTSSIGTPSSIDKRTIHLLFIIIIIVDGMISIGTHASCISAREWRWMCGNAAATQSLCHRHSYPIER